MIRVLLSVLALMLASASLAQAQAITQAQVNAALRADPQIWASLQAIAAAREIRDRCPSIDAREFRARADVLSLYNRARGLGYSRQQIRDFVDDEAEKARLRAEVVAWFGQRGVQESSPPDAFCQVGMAEIAGDTLPGRYLRAQ